MQKKADGQNYAPKGKSKPVCSKDDFQVGVIGLDHGHIYGMCNGLSEAGGGIAMVWDSDNSKLKAFQKHFPAVTIARCEEEVLEAKGIRLIASAAIPDRRGPLGLRTMAYGKDYFTDKPPFVTMEQVAEARKATQETGKKFGVYYSERLHVEASVCAEELIRQGAIGRVIHVMGSGPHRGSLKDRPEWFFDKKRYGGILVDLGCHQIEQILYFSGTSDGSVVSSRTANYYHKEYENFEDFGDAIDRKSVV